MSNTIYIPSYSLSPDRLSIYNTRVNLDNSDYKKNNSTSYAAAYNALNNIYKDGYNTDERFHNFEISKNAHKAIKSKIQWLGYLAKNKTIKTISGKELFNFRLNFITLTLPSIQKHPTSFITKNCLNQFLIEMKQKVNLENFVWRLEFQKNNNVHYHLVTDTFIDYFIIQKTWNRIINKFGYVDDYNKKFALMTLNEYSKLPENTKINDFKIIQEKYARGKKTEWRVPNSVDVKSVLGSKKIGGYIAKYFGKNDNEKNKCNHLDNKENSKGLRLWFCSRSLSALKKISGFLDEWHVDIMKIVNEAKDLFIYDMEYCRTYFFNINSIAYDFKKDLDEILKNYANSLNYQPNNYIQCQT